MCCIFELLQFHILRFHVLQFHLLQFHIIAYCHLVRRFMSCIFMSCIFRAPTSDSCSSTHFCPLPGYRCLRMLFHLLDILYPSRRWVVHLDFFCHQVTNPMQCRFFFFRSLPCIASPCRLKIDDHRRWHQFSPHNVTLELQSSLSSLWCHQSNVSFVSCRWCPCRIDYTWPNPRVVSWR